MSLSGKREEFQAALATVDGVAGFLSKPSTPRPGDAWPMWRGGEPDDSGFIVHTWAVAVFLPQDTSAADVWIDSHIDDLLEALRPVAFVDGYTPANFGPENSPQYGLLINTRSE